MDPFPRSRHRRAGLRPQRANDRGQVALVKTTRSRDAEFSKCVPRCLPEGPGWPPTDALRVFGRCTLEGSTRRLYFPAYVPPSERGDRRHRSRHRVLPGYGGRVYQPGETSPLCTPEQRVRLGLAQCSQPAPHGLCTGGSGSQVISRIFATEGRSSSARPPSGVDAEMVGNRMVEAGSGDRTRPAATAKSSSAIRISWYGRNNVTPSSNGKCSVWPRGRVVGRVVATTPQPRCVHSPSACFRRSAQLLGIPACCRSSCRDNRATTQWTSVQRAKFLSQHRKREPRGVGVKTRSRRAHGRARRL
jgi:hypothetical protein